MTEKNVNCEEIIAEEVIYFWFQECNPKDWFVKSDAFDEQIRARFFETYQAVVRGETKHWRKTPEGRLAEVIVLDQFPRNMFRETRRAFESDELALGRARDAVALGDDKKLPRKKRHFLYMPYMHSESPEIHREALPLFFSLGNFHVLKYEWQHKRIIDRFGRFPHRNRALGRRNTREEVVFLKKHKGF